MAPQQGKDLVIGLGKGIFFYLFKAYPAMINRAIQPNPTGDMLADKHFHDNFKMGIGMLDHGQ